MKRWRPDLNDVLFLAGLLMVAGALWWLVHPALALLLVGVACVTIGIIGVLRA